MLRLFRLRRHADTPAKLMPSVARIKLDGSGDWLLPWAGVKSMVRPTLPVFTELIVGGATNHWPVFGRCAVKVSPPSTIVLVLGTSDTALVDVEPSPFTVVVNVM